MMDTVLLALCFVAMAVLVLAWSMLPHGRLTVASVEHLQRDMSIDTSFEPNAA